MIRILLVDDHASSRQPLAFLLDREDDLTVIAEASSVAEALSVLNGIDVAVVDLMLPDGSGVDIVSALRRTNPHAAVLVLTASEDRMNSARAVEAGAAGVLYKSASLQRIIDAIRCLSAGEQIHSTAEIIELFRLAGERRQRETSERKALDSLTAREKEVLLALARGYSDKEIATCLNIGPRTARSHMANILGKLQADSRLQAVIIAMRCGLVSPDGGTLSPANGYFSHLPGDFAANPHEV